MKQFDEPNVSAMELKGEFNETIRSGLINEPVSETRRQSAGNYHG